MPASSATWLGPTGHRPVVSFSGLNRGSDASLPSPNWGAPPAEPTGLPSRPKISALFDGAGEMVPPAAATSGNARTFRSSDSGTVAAPL